MSELKIITHTTYTYETSDGREFEDKLEAEAWEESLEKLRSIVMLNSKFKPTSKIDSAFFVHIRTWEEQEAFATAQLYEGLTAYIPEPGYWYYDERTDEFVDAVKERDRLQSIIETLDVF